MPLPDSLLNDQHVQPQNALPIAPPVLPLISCIMPTAGRAEYVEQSIDMFLRQDYLCKELIIVYNRDTDLPAITFPSSVKLVRSVTQVLGNKRNEGCRHAAGAIPLCDVVGDYAEPGNLHFY